MSLDANVSSLTMRKINIKKFDTKDVEGLFIRYSILSKDFRVFSKRNMVIEKRFTLFLTNLH